MTAGTLRRLCRGLALAALAAVLSGCGPIPADTDGTTDRIRGDEIRIGITHNPPWTDTSGRLPAGSEVELMEGFAESLDAEIDWVEDSEGVLADALREGDIDIAIGGYTDDTPWTDQAAVTAPYLEARNDSGVTEKHVMLTRPGENQLLVRLETFLRGEAGR
ncbi:transporter substrate-binding domain-containing protein [Microbacterium sp. RD1]|uniref:transporter substrate-binding domain-containing protein n=1 Tax=Microbacterium sp. RD1 TaxID=3457313 RepID=UPI003FA60451